MSLNRLENSEDASRRDAATYQPGQRIRHAEFGEGVIAGVVTNGFVRAFFVGGGERQVPVVSITPILGRSEQIVRNVESGERRNRRAWLAFQAHALPLIESAAALTSANPASYGV